MRQIDREVAAYRKEKRTTMPRVVLDTNVVVSAHLNPAGLERAVLNWALEQSFFVSEPILNEYETFFAGPSSRSTLASPSI